MKGRFTKYDTQNLKKRLGVTIKKTPIIRKIHNKL